MPLYTYNCKKCGTIEKIVKVIDRDAQVCECGECLERQIDSSSLSFKGQGWYVTDYKGK